MFEIHISVVNKETVASQLLVWWWCSIVQARKNENRAHTETTTVQRRPCKDNVALLRVQPYENVIRPLFHIGSVSIHPPFLGSWFTCHIEVTRVLFVSCCGARTANDAALVSSRRLALADLLEVTSPNGATTTATCRFTFNALL